METIRIALPDSLAIFARERAKAGGHDNISEYIRELIRADQKQNAARLLEAEILKGLASGPAQPVTAQTWATLRASIPGLQ